VIVQIAAPAAHACERFYRRRQCKYMMRSMCSHLSGINRGLERLQCISDIQRQIGKPITMPTANVAKK
jgi:hypothetical protein